MEHQYPRKIKSALISLFYKEPAKALIESLHRQNVKIYSTGGTLDFIQSLGIDAIPVEELTAFPSVFGGRVKTLHPRIFGGILFRREMEEDLAEQVLHAIPDIDLVMVDLYPFEETLQSQASHEQIIEKIDIGGISLIRAGAKNFRDVLIIPSSQHYEQALTLIDTQEGVTYLDQRKRFASEAFKISSHYDTAIFQYLTDEPQSAFKQSILQHRSLRYGENPHQQGYFYGDLDQVFTQLHGKELSYNNLLDIDGAVNLIREFDQPSFAIIKHTNACGVASRSTLMEAWQAALASDPVSAFGGILITNRNIDAETAYAINELFFEVILAPGFASDAMAVLQGKKNRIILQLKSTEIQPWQYRSALNGVLQQSANEAQTPAQTWQYVTQKQPSTAETEDLLFANKIVKHTKSNAIVMVKNQQLLASGTGQTSRVDALKQAIDKAAEFKHPLQGAVLASDAFFPFADCVEIAHQAGITAVIQPGGSIRDQESVDYCNAQNMAMVFTAKRYFKH